MLRGIYEQAPEAAGEDDRREDLSFGLIRKQEKYSVINKSPVAGKMMISFAVCRAIVGGILKRYFLP